MSTNSTTRPRAAICTVLLLIVLALSSQCVGQTGVISGKVTDRVNNEPIPFANILLQGTNIGTVTNEDGKYKFESLLPGQYNIEISSVGYKKQSIFEIQVTNARPAIIDVSLEEESQQLQAVEVDASNTFFKTDESPVSLRTIGTTEIKRTPGGNRDISKVIRSLPGVASPPSFRNDIIIRGGAPSENTFYLDGIQIPVINHFQTQGSSGGPVGMINVDLLKEVNFYSGAFPVNRGNTLSSVFDFRLKDPREDKWTSNGIIGATDIGITFEGPVSQNSSVVLSVRRSYLKFLFSALNLPFLPVYNDLQFKYKIDINEKNKVTILGIGAVDDFTLNFDAPEKAQTELQKKEALYLLRVLPVTSQWNYTTGLKYQHFRSNGSTSFVFSINTLNNDIVKYQDNDQSNAANLIQDYSSKEKEVRFRVEDYAVSKAVKFNYGASIERPSYNTKEFNKIVANSGIIERSYSSDLSFIKWAVFGQVSKNFFNDKLVSSIGLRADANNYASTMTNLLDQMSPRLSASYAINDVVSLNFNTGIYYQLPAYTVLGFQENNILVNKQNGVKFIRSDHLVGGVDVNLKHNSHLTVEAFYKKYSNYPFQLDDSISLANLGADFGTIGNAPVSSTSRGRSYGFEFLFQQKLFRGFYGLLSYTIFRSEFEDKVRKRIPSAWDYKHLVSMTGGKRLNRNWEVGFRFLLTGGAPYTPYDLPATLRRENWDIRSFGVSDYNQLNSQRIKPYHQLDIRVDKKYFFRKWSIDLYLDIQNIYNYTTRFQDNIDIQRDGNGNPLIDPNNSNYYLPEFIRTTNGTVLPTVGLIIEL